MQVCGLEFNPQENIHIVLAHGDYRQSWEEIEGPLPAPTSTTSIGSKKEV
jgi:hypothetical protein